MKHVIITGAAGFIGSHLCDRFLERGYAVTGIDNLLTGREENIEDAQKNPSFQFLKMDVCEVIPPRSLHFLDQFGLDGVLHFACPASPVDFDRIPFEILSVDSVGTMNTVSLALQYGARYVLASTSEIYGDPLEHPQKESYWGNVNSIGPRACYDEAKRFAEAYVSAAIRGVRTPESQSPTILNGGIVRIFNTYGPRMRADDGRVVPELCMQALKGKPMTIHGDGSQTRSFCYVDDLVEGIIALYESSETQPVNLGNPVERSIHDFAILMNKATGKESPIENISSRPDDPKRRCPDITRAQKILDWQPKVSLEEGLKHTVEYFRKFV